MEEPGTEITLSPVVQSVIEGFITPELPSGPSIKYSAEDGTKTGTVKDALMQCRFLRELGESDPNALTRVLQDSIS